MSRLRRSTAIMAAASWAFSPMLRISTTARCWWLLTIPASFHSPIASSRSRTVFWLKENRTNLGHCDCQRRPHGPERTWRLYQVDNPGGERRELICPSCQLVADIFACDVGQITSTFPRVPCPIRGAFRDRHERWAVGCDGRLRCAGRAHGQADGEVVWS